MNKFEMRQFEKIWQRSNLSNMVSKPTAERLWRECLTWVKSRITEKLKLLSLDDNVACVKNIENDIRQELGECRKVDDNDGRGFRLVCENCNVGKQLKCQEQTTKADSKRAKIIEEEFQNFCSGDNMPDTRDGRGAICKKRCNQSHRDNCNAVYNG